jgi:hypothetical protein
MASPATTDAMIAQTHHAETREEDTMIAIEKAIARLYTIEAEVAADLLRTRPHQIEL